MRWRTRQHEERRLVGGVGVRKGFVEEERAGEGQGKRSRMEKKKEGRGRREKIRKREGTV